ncbi:type II secretion system protein N [Variovorax sp. PCZ-1]|uniref:type II secretion system protein N n=1 Tax=Variovorax sp. PCZ-1 TaxID=2835533 RepID=UPI001BCFD990|nr:type II secretion system protein N [Variovorax sp. PCZ-1]MBS7806182.1 type II secretion system protein N [Variovorax sp. PCZ-1]
MKISRRSNKLADSHRAPWRTAALAACVGAALATVLFAPAAWLSHAVEFGSQGRVLLAEPQGSVWRGSAQLLLTGGQGSSDAASLPGRVDWTLRPAWHGARMALNLPCCAPEAVQLALKPGWSQSVLEVSPAQVNLPAPWLSGLGAPWNTLDPQGQLSLNTQALQVLVSSGRLRFEGQLTLDLLAMSSRLSTLSPLGDYRLTLAGGDVPTLALQTLQGALQLSGSGQVVGSRIRFTGEASASPQQQDALSNVLNIIGRRQGTKSLISLG